MARMQFYHWSCLLLLLAVLVTSTFQYEDDADGDQIAWSRPPGLAYNWRYNPYIEDNPDTLENQSAESSEIESETFQAPKKRNLSLLSWWKTLEQIRRNNSPRYLTAKSDNIQTKKMAKPTQEIFQVPEISKDIITAVSRGYRRSLRPPGQPLRFG